ncbi:tyrosine-type recombinase/integrase [Streptomyces syringium]|uniref:tyrosine-type recombinase/integrase n=1 Tax=Streptomyces syringium TaxID=76729 RepID=UPI003D8CD6CC
MLDANGTPIVESDGSPKVRQLGSACPLLKKRDHGTWYFYLRLPDGPGGKRRRPRKGGWLTQEQARKEAQKLWDQAHIGIDVDSKETVAEYLHRWLDMRLDLKRSSEREYRSRIDRVFIPAIGHLPLRDLREQHIQEMFLNIRKENEIKAANRLAVAQAREACAAAHRRWKQAPMPRPPELRAQWKEAQAALKEARSKPLLDTGPGTQKNLKNTLAAALKYAVRQKLITRNWAETVVLPNYEKPEPLVWTDERVARWRETGEKPSPVMVWTPEQTGAFLDGVVDHPFYIMWHLQVFRGTRRGETAGLPWAEVNLSAGTIHVTEQLVTWSSQVYTDTPKSRSGRRTIKLDAATLKLLIAWRDAQATMRAERERTGTWHATGYVFTQEDGRPHHPENISQRFNYMVKYLDLPPIRLHDLRHCAASLSLAAGLSIKAIQALLGHSTYQLTADTYTSLMPQFEQASADAPVALVPRQQQPSCDPEPPRAMLALVPTDPEVASAELCGVAA